MQLKNLGLAAILAVGAAADAVVSHTWCSHFAVFETCTSYNAAWYSDTNSYNTNADEGCRDPGVPHIREACYDWKNGRAHFLANGQPKRCLKLNYRRTVRDANRQIERATLDSWVEVPCSW